MPSARKIVNEVRVILERLLISYLLSRIFSCLMSQRDYSSAPCSGNISNIFRPGKMIPYNFHLLLLHGTCQSPTREVPAISIYVFNRLQTFAGKQPATSQGPSNANP